MSDRRVLHVCLDARLISGTAGGVETVVIGLAQGFRALADPDLHLTFLVYAGEDGWLRPHLDPHWSVVVTARPGTRQWVRRLGPFAGVARLVKQKVRAIRPPALAVFETSLSDGVVESTGAQVLHFPHQEGFLSSVPTIYQPHDLQHRHLPDFFSEAERKRRDRLYGDMCNQSAAVVVGTSWVKDDVVEQLSVPPERVHVVPLAPVRNDRKEPTPAEAEVVLKRLGFDAPFALYPASMWLHKNHVRLLDALVLLREQGLVVPIVFTGAASGREEAVRREIAARQLDDQVTVAGFLPENDLDSLYAATRMVVVPTLFESASFPIWEAFLHGVPVACSDVTSLPRQVADAAVLFDPTDVTAMAAAIKLVWTDEDLRERLMRQGAARVSEFTWRRTAEGFRAVYRQVAGLPLTPTDQALLRCDPPI